MTISEEISVVHDRVVECQTEEQTHVLMSTDKYEQLRKEWQVYLQAGTSINDMPNNRW